MLSDDPAEYFYALFSAKGGVYRHYFFIDACNGKGLLT